MNKPTKEQIQQFWEKCGFRFCLSASENPHYWLDPQGRAVNSPPPPDLNNLFKWAVPKLDEGEFDISLYRLLGEHKEDYTEGWTASVGNDGLNIAVYKSDNNPAIALFWAIWEVLK